MSTRSDQRKDAAEHGLYDPAYEHDACGVGFVASVKGQASHEIVTQALQILKNLDHRGAVGADPLCGDGAGILIQIPDAFFRAEMAKQNILLPPAGDYGVGMIFLPREHASRRACEQELERVVKAEGQVVLGWRDVPVDTTIRMSKTVWKPLRLFVRSSSAAVPTSWCRTPLNASCTSFASLPVTKFRL